MAISFVFGLLLIDLQTFLADETMYVYAGFAISRGEVPYRDIVLAQPPLMYLFYALVISIGGNTLFAARFGFLILHEANILLTFLLFKKLIKDDNAEEIAVGVAILYAVFPGIWGLVYKRSNETLLILFTLLSTYYFVDFLEGRSKLKLMISGVFGGMALMTKMLALFFLPLLFLFSVFGYILVYARKGKEGENMFSRLTRCVKSLIQHSIGEAGIFLLGISVVPLMLLLWLQMQDALQNYYLQTIYWQSIRLPHDLFERVLAIENFLDRFLPLSPIAPITILGFFHTSRAAVHQKKAILALPVWIFLSNFLAMALLLNRVFDQHFLILMPFVLFLDVYGFLCIYQKIRSGLKARSSGSRRLILLIFLIISLFLPLLFSFRHDSSYLSYASSPNVYLKMNEEQPVFQSEVGNYIESVTSGEDRIWVSDGAIAFFAQRLIVPANSSEWPWHSCFAAAIGYFLSPKGEVETGDGTLSVREFLEAWEEKHPRVIIIKRRAGRRPIDYYLWNGRPEFDDYEDSALLRTYVASAYNLNRTFQQDVLEYEVWVRN
jgi:hypothetical protein